MNSAEVGGGLLASAPDPLAAPPAPTLARALRATGGGPASIPGVRADVRQSMCCLLYTSPSPRDRSLS
eukprot:1559675-Pyramimonas_sp.AAC.1